MSIQLEPGSNYMVFVGHPKYVRTGDPLAASMNLSSISILSDHPGRGRHGDDDQYIVVNPELGGRDPSLYRGEPEMEAFASYVRDDPRVSDLMRQLGVHQGQVYVDMFQTFSGFPENAIILGPDPLLRNYMEERTHQRELADDVGVPIPQGEVIEPWADLKRAFVSLKNSE